MPNEACCLSQLELVAYQRQEINSLFILIISRETEPPWVRHLGCALSVAPRASFAAAKIPSVLK